MPYILQYVEGGTQKKVEFNEPELKLGRSPDCGLILPLPGISRHHCKIVREGSGFAIEDLHSKNGTRVNNIYINRQKLSDNDEIALGDLIIRFEQIPEMVADGWQSPDAGSTDEMVLLSEEKQLHEEAGTIIREASEVQDILEQQQIADQGSDARRIIAVVLEVAGALIAVKSLEEVIGKLMNLIFENLPADRGCLMLRNEAGILQSRVVKHRDPNTNHDALEISKTIANKALNDMKSILTTDAQVDPRFSAGESIRFLGIKSAMCVPLFNKRKTIGIIYLDSPTSAAIFSPTDLDLLTALANFAAVGIEQAMLNDKIQQETSIRERLERYHSPTIVDRILENINAAQNQSTEFHLTAEERDVSVLFTDIVGFTPMAARMPPQRIANLLNEYFSEMTDVIFRYQGTLDKYIGDAIMAIFGAPNTMKDHAYAAVCTALDMMERLHVLNAARPDEARFSIRIGINSGGAVAGDIGSIKRMEYTVLGNTVNVASRIESMACKPNQIVIGESTQALVADRFVYEPLGPILLKGLSKETNVYRVLSRA